MEILRSAEVMMDALPVCRVRGISYATFTIVDAVLHGWTRVIEMDNPPFLLVRGGRVMAPGRRVMASSRWKDRKITVNEFFARPEDRIILFSDGVTQAGMGSWANPTGWGRKNAPNSSCGCCGTGRTCHPGSFRGASSPRPWSGNPTSGPVTT